MVCTNHKRGFTILEMLVVMGIFTLVGSFALFVSMESFHESNFRSDRNTLVAALERARAESMNNICIGTCTDGKPHGVKILSINKLVIFQGSTYATRDTGVDAIFDLNIATTSGASEFIFSQLSGTSTATSTTMTDPTGHVSTMTISSQGQISWTN